MGSTESADAAKDYRENINLLDKERYAKTVHRLWGKQDYTDHELELFFEPPVEYGGVMMADGSMKYKLRYEAGRNIDSDACNLTLDIMKFNMTTHSRCEISRELVNEILEEAGIKFKSRCVWHAWSKTSVLEVDQI